MAFTGTPMEDLVPLKERVSETAADFQKQLNDFVDVVEGDVDAIVRKTALDLYTNIVNRTPVDTGHARSNWFIDSSYDPGKKDTFAGEKGGANGAAATRNAMSRAQSANLSGDQIHIYNNLQYIEALESGHSGQAPVGMVAPALASFAATLRKNSSKIRGGAYK